MTCSAVLTEKAVVIALDQSKKQGALGLVGQAGGGSVDRSKGAVKGCGGRIDAHQLSGNNPESCVLGADLLDPAMMRSPIVIQKYCLFDEFIFAEIQSLGDRYTGRCSNGTIKLQLE